MSSKCLAIAIYLGNVWISDFVLILLLVSLQRWKEIKDLEENFTWGQGGGNILDRKIIESRFFFWLPKPKVTRSTWSAHPRLLLVSVDFFGGPWSTGDEISVAVTAQMPVGVLVVKTVVTLQKNNSAQQPCNSSIAQAALGTIRHAGSGEQTAAHHTHSLCHSFPAHHLKLSSAFLQNLSAGLCQPPPLAHGQPLSPAPLAHPLSISHVKYFSECSYSDASCSASLPIAHPKFLLEPLNTTPCFAPLCQWSHWSFWGQQVGEFPRNHFHTLYAPSPSLLSVVLLLLKLHLLSSRRKKQ